jgi:hypothetical protein
VEQREIGLILRQKRQEIRERGEDGQAHAPAVAVSRAVQRDLPHDIRRRHAAGELAVHRLGDDQAEVVGEPVVEPVAPMRRRIGVAEGGLHPDVRAAHFDRAGRHVVGPQIEGAAAGEIEARVVPVAGEDPVLDAAAFERKAHVRTAIIEREHAPAVMHHQDRAMWPAHHEPPLGLELLEATGVDEARDRNIHGARPIRPSSADPQPLRFDNVAWRSLVVATLTSRFSAAPPRDPRTIYRRRDPRL